MAVGNAGTGQTTDNIAALLEDAPVPAHTIVRRQAPPPRPATLGPPLRISVVWGNLTEVEADVHVVGHYQGVLPTSAEAALDAAISSPRDATLGEGRRVIEEATRRRWLVEQLGVVTFFPVAGSGHQIRRAAVVSMGRVGTFNQRRAVQLYESLAARMSSLDSIVSVATVAIGSGAGNLSAGTAMGALVEGAMRARRAVASRPGERLEHLIVVEMDRLRADAIHAELKRAVDDAGEEVDVDPTVGIGTGGRISRRGAVDLLSRAVAELAFIGKDADAARVIDRALHRLHGEEAPLVQHELRKLAASGESTTHSARLDTELTAPIRLSVVTEESALRWGAITDQATVPERILPVPKGRLEQLVTRLDRPADKDVGRLGEGLSRLLVPVDLQNLLGDHAPVVVEVDNETARLQWEMLVDLSSGPTRREEPLAVRTPIARQLRTTYSRLGVAADEEQGRRALVIGDPGNPRTHRSLPAARVEATSVADALGPPRGDWDVNLFLTAPDAERIQEDPSTSPADSLDVLMELMTGSYQVVHFAGHGMFDPADPQRRAGLLFADGLLTSQDITNLGRPPRLVIANACFSARLASDSSSPGTASFLPGLADEFLRAGVVHYIGAAWEVGDRAGGRFAEAFYGALMTPGTTVGEAVCRGRDALWKERSLFGCDWAAYQHYGDPCDVLVREGSSRP